MSLNRFVSWFLRKHTSIKHFWRAEGEANFFSLGVTVTHPDGHTEVKWVARIQLNGEMPLAAQSQVLDRMCWSLDIRS